MRQSFGGTVFLLLAAVFVPPSSAQDEDPVVITATRFPDSRRELPVGVTVVTSDDIRTSATSNLPEMLAQFGLLHVRDNAGTPNQQIDLRGFGITGDQNTVVLLDGVRISENELVPAQLSAIPLEAIERIEVVRGSGAVLYGGGATGGTINIITREAPGMRAYALARAGGYGTREGRAGFGRMSEALGFSLDLSHEDTDGYRRNNRFRQTNLSALLEARPGPGTRAYLRLGLGEQDLELPGALSESQIAADPRQAATPGNDSERRDAGVTLGGFLTAGEHELAADLSHRQKKASSLFAPSDFTDTRATLTSFVPRARLKFGPHELMLGMDWERWDYENDSSFFGFASRRAGEQESRALYGQASVWLGARTRFVAGGRVQRSEERLEGVRDSHDLDAYELALRHRIGRGWSVYGKHGTSFRLANFDENACFAPPCPTTLLEPQTARSRELGVDLERGAWQARAAVYDKRLENEIAFSPAAFANVNLAPTRRRGLELEALWRASRAVEWRAALALFDASFRATGRDVPLVPEAVATAGVSWGFSARSRLSVNARYVGPQRYDNDQDNAFRRQPSYTLVDAKLQHRIGRAEIALELRNLLDERYYSYGFWDGATSFFAYPQPERAAYLSLAWRLE
jgi:iron complex outermembrane receptor protein